MAEYDVKGPDGSVYHVVAPDNATPEQVKARVMAQHGRRAPAPKRGSMASGYKPKSDLTKLYAQGGSFGLSDEIIGGAGVLADAVAAPFSKSIDFNPANSYQQWRDAARADIAQTRKEHPWASTAMELVGGLGQAPVKALKGLIGAKSIAQAVKQGAKTGSKMGAAAGFGYGEGTDSSLAGAGIGAVTGAGLGGGIPLVGANASKVYNGAQSYFSPQGGVGRELVARALANSKISPRQAGKALDGARKRGVPLSLSDLSTNLRGLSGAVSRQPGPAREMATNAVTTRQAAQGERVQSALARDLGPTANRFEIGDSLTAQARAAAKPLYEKAYAAPGRSSEELDALLATPAGKQALAAARNIAANERRDPMALGFGLNDQGETILTKVPSTQTLDYVKRGLDDILEAKRDSLTGRLNLDSAGHAVNDVRASLVREMDRLNPDYAAARSAYAGPASSKAALDKGYKAVGANDQELDRMVSNLGDGERQHFALGFRSALSEMLDKRVDGGDKVGALLGNPKKRKALAQLFGGEDGFENFLQTMADERAANETFRKVTGGSDTARFLADDAAVSDQSMLADAAGAAMRGAVDDGWKGAARNLFGQAKDAYTFGAGKAGERAREDASSLLFETDPKALAESMRKAMRDQALRRVRERNVNSGTARAGAKLGQLSGGIAGTAVNQADPYAGANPLRDQRGNIIGYVHPNGQLEVIIDGGN